MDSYSTDPLRLTSVIDVTCCLYMQANIILHTSSILHHWNTLLILPACSEHRGYFSHLNPNAVMLSPRRCSGAVRRSAIRFRIRMQCGEASSQSNMTSWPQGYMPARADRQIYDMPLISAFHFMVPNFRFRLRCSLNQFCVAYLKCLSTTNSQPKVLG